MTSWRRASRAAGTASRTPGDEGSLVGCAYSLAGWSGGAVADGLQSEGGVLRGDAYGKCALVFKSPLHAQLAFDTLAGPAEEDTSGRPQKKIYLDDGGGSGKRPYCKVRPF